jgi:antimicrobial peptide system SdpA family protein
MAELVQRTRWLGTLFLVLVVGWSLVLLSILAASLPFSPLSVSRRFKDQIVTFMPEGWGFFTRNPREEHTVLYQHQGDAWILRTLPNANGYLGASRSMRSQAGELALLLKTVSPKAWRQTTGSIASCPMDSAVTIINVYDHPTLCGQYRVRVQDPVPWAWSRLQTLDQRKYKFLNITVRCMP